MLYNLNFLEKGQQFPPQDERDRLQRYAQNKKIFEGEHAKVYEEQMKRIQKVVGTVANVISYPIVLNFQKKMSLKCADLLFLEPPQFTTTDEKKQKVIDTIVSSSKLIDIGYEGAIDCSRYGTAVYKIDIDDGKGKVSLSSPEYLFIVVDEADRKKILHYVIAWTFEKEEQGRKKNYLKAIVHSKGSYKSMLYEVSGSLGAASYTVMDKVEDTGEVKTGLTDFAVVPVHNLVTSDSVYGIDDYMDVDSLVSELEVRTAQISKILDVFASPTVSGTTAALEKDEAGGYTFNAGNFYARNSVEEPPLEYITWQANLDANFRQIDKLLGYLATISEMGAAIFVADLRTGNTPSGSALRKLYINVLAKVSRLRNNFDSSFKTAIAIASQAGHTALEQSDISITWQDGLPNDPREEAEIMAMRTSGSKTMSVKRALKLYDGFTSDAAEKEVLEINQEQGK